MFAKERNAQRPIRAIAQRFLVVVFLLSNSALAEEVPWELQRQDGSISIYSRSVEGSSYLAIKATVLIDAPITSVSPLMGDGNGCAKWRAKCKSSEVLEVVSENERFMYMVLDLPWPAADRDLVLQSTTTIDTKGRSAVVNLESASSRHPPADYVRAETSGKFVIRETQDAQVEFTYIMHTDLGGDLPTGMVNSGLAEAAFKDLFSLQKLAESSEVSP